MLVFAANFILTWTCLRPSCSCISDRSLHLFAISSVRLPMYALYAVDVVYVCLICMPPACVRVLVRGAADVPLSLGQPGKTRGRDTGRVKKNHPGTVTGAGGPRHGPWAMRGWSNAQARLRALGSVLGNTAGKAETRGGLTAFLAAAAFPHSCGAGQQDTSFVSPPLCPNKVFSLVLSLSRAVGTNFQTLY